MERFANVSASSYAVLRARYQLENLCFSSSQRFLSSYSVFFLCSYHRRVPFLSCFRVKCSSLDVFCDVVVGILVWRYERSAGIVKRRVEAGAIVRDSITNILDYWKRFPVHVLLSMKLILQRNTFSATDAQKGRSNFAPPQRRTSLILDENIFFSLVISEHTEASLLSRIWLQTSSNKRFGILVRHLQDIHHCQASI